MGLGNLLPLQGAVSGPVLCPEGDIIPFVRVVPYKWCPPKNGPSKDHQSLESLTHPPKTCRLWIWQITSPGKGIVRENPPHVTGLVRWKPAIQLPVFWHSGLSCDLGCQLNASVGTVRKLLKGGRWVASFHLYHWCPESRGIGSGQRPEVVRDVCKWEVSCNALVKFSCLPAPLAPACLHHSCSAALPWMLQAAQVLSTNSFLFKFGW